MPLDMEKIGCAVRRYRKEKGLTQEILSGLAGLSRSHLASIEAGAPNVTVETLSHIADALGMNLSELVREAEKEAEKET